MTQKTPYIGSTISLISKLNIRYEGILYTVNSAASTIALAQVRSFGTENRPTSRPVPARNEIYEYIIFKASDIKDLVVCDTPKQETRPSYRQHQPNSMFYQRGNAPPFRNQKDRLKFDSDYDFEKANQQFQQTLNSLGLDLERITFENECLKEESQTEVKAEPNDAEIVNENEKILENLNDESIVSGTTADDDISKARLDDKDMKKPPTYYDKSTSFFDCISCETQEKEEGKNIRPDWKKERQTNQETFGHSAVRSLAFRRNARTTLGGFKTLKSRSPLRPSTFRFGQQFNYNESSGYRNFNSYQMGNHYQQSRRYQYRGSAENNSINGNAILNNRRRTVGSRLRAL